MLGFYVSPTAKVIRRRDLGFKVSSERLEEPGIERTTPGLEGKWLNHYTTEARTVRKIWNLTSRFHPEIEQIYAKLKQTLTENINASNM